MFDELLKGTNKTGHLSKVFFYGKTFLKSIIISRKYIFKRLKYEKSAVLRGDQVGRQ